MARPGFTYNGGSTEFEFSSAIPLRFREGSYADVQNVFRAVALDERTVRVESFGDGAEEVIGMIRFEGDPGALLAFLRAGSNGDTLVYYPDLDTPGINYPVILMNHGRVAQITMDRQRFGFGEWEVEVVLRRIDGGTLSGIFP